jgi:hypothetical protein
MLISKTAQLGGALNLKRKIKKLLMTKAMFVSLSFYKNWLLIIDLKTGF